MTKYYFVAYSCGNVIGNALLEVTNTSLEGIKDYIVSTNNLDRDKLIITSLYGNVKNIYQPITSIKIVIETIKGTIIELDRNTDQLFPTEELYNKYPRDPEKAWKEWELKLPKYEVRIEYGKRGTMFGLYDSIGLTLLDGLTETRCKEIFQKLKEILEHEKAV